ncbi:spermidine synthase [Cohnella panacarvi]|uniref:spermidine synthase n=1 Tax=Cohnella panacarvi TaxID=400776 RepID=UPI00047A9643|nr:fused MFS/spermidine synthase [Cohnella panacarvi]
MQLLAKTAGRFNEIRIYESSELYGKTGRYRLMGFEDGAVQGAMDLRDPRRVVLEYQQAVVHLMDSHVPSFEDAFVIGHGIGTIAAHYPNKRFVVAEIDDEVVELSKQYFGCRTDHVIIGDGRRILEEQPPRSFDYVILDAFTPNGTPWHLLTLQFFETAMDKLRPAGAAILNLTGKRRNDRLISAIYATLCETCEHVSAYYLPVVGAGDSDAGNVIIAGGHRPIEARQKRMAGFTEIDIERGHRLRDN